MAHFSPQALLAVLAELRPAAASGDLCVAFSGGVDSAVLLAALAELKAAGEIPGLRAHHVNHQLHPDADRWQRRCLEFAAALGVPCMAQAVEVTGAAAAGVEAAARVARYAVLHRELAPGEILVTAHHADDQLETVLLALTRGSGVRGLAGMPRSVECGQGWHQRPFLSFTRAEIAAWGRVRGLSWIEDPANAHVRYSRSFLRQTVVPLLRDRWPAVAIVVSRSAGHLAEASGLLDELARGDLAAAEAGECLKVAVLAGLSSPRRRNLLRFWLRKRSLPLPGTAKLKGLEHDVLVARADRQVCVMWTGAEVRRHRGLLYAGAPLPAPGSSPQLSWNWREPLALPEGCGELHAIEASGEGLAIARLPARLKVSARVGGERILAERPGESPQRALKKLLQEAHVLPWWRDRLPLLSAGGRLVAVGDLWVARAFAAQPEESGVRIEWRGRPPILAAP